MFLTGITLCKDGVCTDYNSAGLYINSFNNGAVYKLSFSDGSGMSISSFSDLHKLENKNINGADVQPLMQCAYFVCYTEIEDKLVVMLKKEFKIKNSCMMVSPPPEIVSVPCAMKRGIYVGNYTDSGYYVNSFNDLSNEFKKLYAKYLLMG